jgi:hypothetical protein
MLNVYADAHAKMVTALEELDGVNAPGEIGAHLDLAICRLEDLINAANSQNATNLVEAGAK